MSNQRESVATALKELQNEISIASMRFACSMMSSLLQQEPEGNVIFSPVSVYSTLALIYFGATGNTRCEIAKVMGLPEEIESQDLLKILSKILHSMRVVMETTGRTTRAIDIKNQIFVQKDMNLMSSYVSRITSISGCEILSVDFEKESENATNIINHFVSRNTSGGIVQCLAEPVDHLTRIVLASCTNLKLIWEEKFQHQLTKSAKFHTERGDVDVEMMQYKSCEELPYVVLPSLHLEALELPGKEKHESIYIILPELGKSLDDIVSSLDDTVLQLIIKNVVPAFVDVNLPRLNLACTRNLCEVLRTLGVDSAFGDQAQLNNMTSDALLHVSKIIHAVRVEFGEGKMKASSKIVKPCITHLSSIKDFYKVKMVPYALVFDEARAVDSLTNPIWFDVNRPFLFFIYHRTTKSILFLGMIRNPVEFPPSQNFLA